MIFLDPPYASHMGEMTLTALAGRHVLTPHGVLIWQHAARDLAPPAVLDLPLWKSRRYGSTQLSLYASSELAETPDDEWPEQADSVGQ
jgi:16S rRNA G966 N2-methylase RsmD